VNNVQNVQTGKSIVVFAISNFLKRHLMIATIGSSKKYLKTFLFYFGKPFSLLGSMARQLCQHVIGMNPKSVGNLEDQSTWCVNYDIRNQLKS